MLTEIASGPLVDETTRGAGVRVVPRKEETLGRKNAEPWMRAVWFMSPSGRKKVAESPVLLEAHSA